jgi:septal ring factor EnvC (AmiA/AmiB activator)
MKNLNIKRIFIFCFGISFILILIACDNIQRETRNAGTTETEETSDVFEARDAELEERRERVAFNLERQISRIRKNLDSLRNELPTATVKDKSLIENQLKTLDNRIENLEEQQKSLIQADLERLVYIEKYMDSVLFEKIETQEQDRAVRGEGTSLSGPDLNRTGTRTGTEIDTQVPVEIEGTHTERTAIPTEP